MVIAEVAMEQIAPEQELTEKALTWPERARALQITDQPSYDTGVELIKGIKALRAEVDATFDPICKSAFDAHRTAVAAKKKAETPLAEAEQILRKAIANFQIEQQRIQQERERQTRIESERIRREQQLAYEAEQRRMREERERLEQDQRIADAVQAEQEGAAPEEVQAILEAPAVVAPMVMPVAPPPPVVMSAPAPTFTRAEGVSKPRDNWSGEVTDIVALAKYVGEHPEWAQLIQPHTTAINQLARVQKDLLAIPGVVARNNPTISVGRQ